jgi:hypothetical protein
MLICDTKRRAALGFSSRPTVWPGAPAVAALAPQRFWWPVVLERPQRCLAAHSPHRRENITETREFIMPTSGFAFGHSDADRNNAPSSGNGGDGRVKPSDPLESHAALRGLAATRDNEGDFRRAQSAASGIASDGGAGGVAIGGGDQFGTVGHASGDDFSTVTAGQDDLVQRGDLPPSSNSQSGGMAI